MENPGIVVDWKTTNDCQKLDNCVCEKNSKFYATTENLKNEISLLEVTIGELHSKLSPVLGEECPSKQAEPEKINASSDISRFLFNLTYKIKDINHKLYALTERVDL